MSTDIMATSTTKLTLFHSILPCFIQNALNLASLGAVARKFKQIAPLVARLRKSVGEKSVRALGFDLEYCTLDIDIRGDLPAVATLASYPDIVGILKFFLSWFIITSSVTSKSTLKTSHSLMA